MLLMILGFVIAFFIFVICPLLLRNDRFSMFLLETPVIRVLFCYIFECPLIIGIWDLIWGAILGIALGAASIYFIFM